MTPRKKRLSPTTVKKLAQTTKQDELPPGLYKADITDVRTISDRAVELSLKIPRRDEEQVEAVNPVDYPDFPKMIEQVVDAAMKRARTKRFTEQSEEQLVNAIAYTLKAITKVNHDAQETRTLVWKLQEQVYELKNSRMNAVTDAFRRGLELAKNHRFE